MKSEQLVGIITAVLVMVGLSGLINSGSPTPILQWPSEAFIGIAFTFGWLTRSPAWLAYLVAILIVVIIASAGYLLGRFFWRVVRGGH